MPDVTVWPELIGVRIDDEARRRRYPAMQIRGTIHIAGVRQAL